MAYASTTRVVLYAGFNPMAMLSCIFGIPLLRRHHSGLGLHGGWVGAASVIRIFMALVLVCIAGVNGDGCQSGE